MHAQTGRQPRRQPRRVTRRQPPRPAAAAPSALIAILLLALGLPGCSNAVRRTFLSLTDAADRATVAALTISEQEPLVVIDVPGPLGLDVESLGGDVDVVVNPKLTQATITFIRRALHGAGRTDDARAALHEIVTSATIGSGAFGPSLLIRTSAPGYPEPHFLRVDVRVEAPDLEGIRIVTSRGAVHTTNIGGEIDIRTDGGDIRVLTIRPLTRAVTLVNDDGDVDLRMRGNSTGAIDGRAHRGTVTQNARLGSVVIHPGTTHDRLLATLNGGTNPITLRAADGAVRLAVVKDPLTVGRWIRN